MDELQVCREEISAIDAELRALFLRRMEVSRRIGTYKREHGLPVTDAGREDVVLKSACAGLESPLRELTAELFRTLISLSKAYQTQSGENAP